MNEASNPYQHLQESAPKEFPQVPTFQWQHPTVVYEQGIPEFFWYLGYKYVRQEKEQPHE